MKLANLNGRLVIIVESGAVDVHRASKGRFEADPQAVWEVWPQFAQWAATVEAPAEPYSKAELGPPVPRPRQVFAIALNYRAHASESTLTPPGDPSVFTKFVTSLTGPYGKIALVDGNVDWEAELVVVIGRPARHVSEVDGWQYVAGLTAGQDVSERVSQLTGDAPQFSLAKSRPGFSPIGPWVVSLDEFANQADLAIGCSVNGEVVQDARTSDLLFSVPVLVARLSAKLPLLPGDLIFTGTPAGVGLYRNPPRFLKDGDEVVTTIEGIGQMAHRFVHETGGAGL